MDMIEKSSCQFPLPVLLQPGSQAKESIIRPVDQVSATVYSGVALAPTRNSLGVMVTHWFSIRGGPELYVTP